MAFAPSANKYEAVSRLATLVGISEANLGPGAKERKQLIEDVAGYLGLNVNLHSSKPALLESIFQQVGQPWQPAFVSGGDTITLRGLDKLLEHALASAPTRGRDLIENAAGPADEANRILDACAPLLTHTLTMKQCVLQMKGSDCRQWAQMEWPGFFVEFRLQQRLRAVLGGTTGRVVGNTRFDYEFLRAWDIKTHVEDDSIDQIVILNDRSAIDTCLKTTHGLGFIIVSGTATYDSSDALRKWIEKLRAGAGKKRRGTSTGRRRMKATFSPTRIDVLWLTRGLLREGLRDGWMLKFTQGQQSTSGAARNPKYRINLAKVPDSVRVASRDL
jgi:hypothetical protein